MNLSARWANIVVPSIAFVAGYGLCSLLQRQKNLEPNKPEEGLDTKEEEQDDDEYDSEEENSDVEIDEENHYKMVLGTSSLLTQCRF
jgi:hypothetical protein